jgi:hypothetical protein
MGRQKTLCTVQLQSAGTYKGWSSTDLCSRDFLQQKYDQALSELRSTTLYAETTVSHLNRIANLFTEFVTPSPLHQVAKDFAYVLRYCSIAQLDPRETLRQCEPARMENFLHWMVKVYTIKKTSSVTTYWRQLSQLHIIWWKYRIEPHTLKQIFVVWVPTASL